MLTGHALEETRHRLVGTPDLDLVEGGLVAVAFLDRALDTALLRIVPGARASEDVILLLALEFVAGIDGLANGVLPGAGATLQAVGALVRERDGEDVCAVGADFSSCVSGNAHPFGTCVRVLCAGERGEKKEKKRSGWREFWGSHTENHGGLYRSGGPRP